MTKILWLASYPRSGNTWLRFLLADLLYGRVANSRQVMERIPDIEWGISARHFHGRKQTVIKTHWRYRPEFPLREDTIGVVYIARNPLDVMVSALNHSRLNGRDFEPDMTEEELEAASRQWIADYIRAGGMKRWTALGFGSWEENVDSWTAGALTFPRIVLRYEDLHSDTAATLARLCRFLGLKHGTDRIAAAIERCSFEAMRAMEEREMEREQPGTFFLANRRQAHKQGVRFVNRGQVGSGKATLTPQEQEAATRRFRPVMERLGYI